MSFLMSPLLNITLHPPFPHQKMSFLQVTFHRTTQLSLKRLITKIWRHEKDQIRACEILSRHRIFHNSEGAREQNHSSPSVSEDNWTNQEKQKKKAESRSLTSSVLPRYPWRQPNRGPSLPPPRSQEAPPRRHQHPWLPPSCNETRNRRNHDPTSKNATPSSKRKRKTGIPQLIPTFRVRATRTRGFRFELATSAEENHERVNGKKKP